MNRLSILIGWLALTFLAIGVSSAAVGSVGERVSPQPASVLRAAGDVVALGGDDEPRITTTRATEAPSSTVIQPGDAGTTSAPEAPTTEAPPSTTTSPGATSTTLGPGETTTTTVAGTTTTVVDGSSTTTTVSPTPTTTTSAPTTTTTLPSDEVNRRTIDSKGGWIRIAWTDDWLRLGAAGPRVGFRLEVVENTGDLIVVRFASLHHLSRVTVRLDDGDAKVEVSEERKRDG